jgi:hypothetical protein
MLNECCFGFSNIEFILHIPSKESSSFLPITVVFAIGLFILKEVLEFIKKNNAQKRKVSAMKKLFSRECEKNFWTVKILRSVLKEIYDGYESHKEIHVRFSEYNPSYVFVIEGEDEASGHSISKTHRELMDKNLMETAVLDKLFFKKLEDACDALAELDHVRDSFLNINNTSEEIGDGLLSAFADYGLNELDDIQKSLNELYKYCTGGELKNARLR